MPESNDLRDDAERFRRLAQVVDDERNRLQLLEMARELDQQAKRLEQAGRTPEAEG